MFMPVVTAGMFMPVVTHTDSEATKLAQIRPSFFKIRTLIESRSWHAYSVCWMFIFQDTNLVTVERDRGWKPHPCNMQEPLPAYCTFIHKHTGIHVSYVVC